MVQKYKLKDLYLTLSILTGLILDLKARSSLSDAYRRMGTARYIHVYKNHINMKCYQPEKGKKRR